MTSNALTNDIRIRFSIGLLIMLTFPTLALIVALLVLHPAPKTETANQVVPSVQPKPKYEPVHGGDIGLPPVNEAARNEVKQGPFRIIQPQSCPTCPQVQPYVNPAPQLRPQVQPYIQPQRPGPAAPQQPSPPSRIGENDKPSQQSSRYEITVFLGTDAKSQMLADWFKTHPTLVEWRSKCTYQEYTANSPLYLTLKDRQGRMLKDVVPPSQFPAVVFAKPDGGHIHAAGGNMIPDTPEQLIADVQLGSKHASEAVMQNSGLLRTSGYSWDTAINPAMRLDIENYNDQCPDGKCPVPNAEDSSRWGQGKIIHNIFGKPSPKNGFVEDALWGWLKILAGAFVAAFLGVLIFILIIVIVISLRNSK